MKTLTVSRSKCSVLHLVLKREWFDMIASGVKREEYRDASPYWAKRLRKWDAATGIPVVEFRLGYAKDAPRMAFWCFGLGTASGMHLYAYSSESENPEWGEPAGGHFLIRIGGRIEFKEEAAE